MKYYEELLENNKKWVDDKKKNEPDFFKNLAKGQKPPVMWIGCSDSRVPASQVTGTLPGELFVHRNIANMVVHSDTNMLSVLDFAVNQLEVNHVIVCGHYGCGGIRAAMTSKQFGFVDNWLRHIKDVYRLHKEEINALNTQLERENRLIELNILEQVNDLSHTSIIQNAWHNMKKPTLHGWVYDLSTGLIKNLKTKPATLDTVDDIFVLDGKSS